MEALTATPGHDLCTWVHMVAPRVGTRGTSIFRHVHLLSCPRLDSSLGHPVLYIPIMTVGA